MFVYLILWFHLIVAHLSHLMRFYFALCRIRCPFPCIPVCVAYMTAFLTYPMRDVFVAVRALCGAR